MRSYRWLLVPAGFVVVGVFIILSLVSAWVNSIVGSDSFRSDVEKRAGQTVSGTVKITQINFSIWRGVTLSGLATKLDSPQGTLVSQVEKVNCSVSPWHCSDIGWSSTA